MIHETNTVPGATLDMAAPAEDDRRNTGPASGPVFQGENPASFDEGEVADQDRMIGVAGSLVRLAENGGRKGT